MVKSSRRCSRCCVKGVSQLICLMCFSGRCGFLHARWCWCLSIRLLKNTPNRYNTYLRSVVWTVSGLKTMFGFGDFLRQVCKRFAEAGFMADADLDSGCLLNKKIRNAQLSQYNFILGKTSIMTVSVFLWRSEWSSSALICLCLMVLQWWVRRNGWLTAWTCAPETTRSTASWRWRRWWPDWLYWSSPGVTMLKKSSKSRCERLYSDEKRWWPIIWRRNVKGKMKSRLILEWKMKCLVENDAMGLCTWLECLE